MTSPPIRFGVADHARIDGCNNLEDMGGVPLLAMATFEEAFRLPWRTDAHFVCYAPEGDDPEAAFPRCNKPVLGKLRAEGVDLLAHTIALDWDTPEHAPWGSGTSTFEDFLAVWEKACAVFEPLASPTVMYTTRKGVRLVYVLDEKVPVDQIESKIRWVVYLCRAVGFLVDELCDWTRLFRLPMVEREGTPTYSDPLFEILVNEDARLPVKSLGDAVKADKPTAYGEIREFNEPKPAVEEARALLEFQREGKVLMTDWAKKAKRRLRGRECWDCLYEHEPLANRGSRDSTIHAYVGQAISLLYNIDDTTPTHIYGLFLPAVEQLEPDAQTYDWTDVLWSAVGRLWIKEEAKVSVQVQEYKEQQARKEDIVEDIVSGMRRWCESGGLHQEQEDAMLWAEGRFIVSSGNSYYIIDDTGYYRPQPFQASQLVAAIRKHIPDLIPTLVPKEDGSGMKEVGLTTLLNRYTTVVNKVEMHPGIEFGYIKDIDTPRATLILPSFNLNKKLKPTFDEEIDLWLKNLFGEDYEKGCQWIAYALAFDEGDICALSIVGGQGVGKKLLVQGLAECLSMPALATDNDLVSQYQYGLLESPFLSVNEGWTSGFGGKHAADRFREIVSGDFIEINRRYRDPIRLKTCTRVIFTANNLDVIRMLAHKKDLTEADREALAIRLLHFDVGNDASDWLKLKGGMAYTSRPGRRWIAPPGGGDSDFIVAKHFLWLHQQRNKWPRGARLLVEGTGAKDLMFEMQTQVGSAPLVIEAILQMLESKIKLDGLVVREGKEVFVTSHSIVDYFRTNMAQKVRETLTANKVATVLQGLTLHETHQPTVLDGHAEQGRRRWHWLDARKILAAGERHGFRSRKLEKIIELLDKDEGLRKGAGDVSVPKEQNVVF